MDIPTYRKEKGLSQEAFAALVTEAGTPASQSLVSQWESGTVKVSPERAIQIEAATGGELNRSHLRPDYWPATSAA